MTLRAVRLGYLGDPTHLIEYGWPRLLVDPTFDDAVLLSHDQHPDNLDAGG